MATVAFFQAAEILTLTLGPRGHSRRPNKASSPIKVCPPCYYYYCSHPLLAFPSSSFPSSSAAIAASCVDLGKGGWPTSRTCFFPRARSDGAESMKAITTKAALVSSPPSVPEIAATHSPAFRNVSTEAELLASIEREVEAKRIPPKAGHGMRELYFNYRNAVLESGAQNGEEMVVQMMAIVLDRVLLQFEDPYTFASYHTAIREPFDYYRFGQNYIRNLIDFKNSYVGNLPIFGEIEKQLKQGHNVILVSNHQSEADPAVIALLLESSHPYISENLTYLAGDRVVLDPFCKPFSMGRNLLCVYSKKRINDEPELASMKRKANTRTLKEMALLLRKGGQLIWIAPSGGRDRPDPATNKWRPAAFDDAAVDNMRRLAQHAQLPAHMYPLSLLCYEIMPPPQEVQKELGEQRILAFHGVGISVGPELCFEDITSGINDSAMASKTFTEAISEQVNSHYDVLTERIYNGVDASSSRILLSQPWKAERD